MFVKNYFVSLNIFLIPLIIIFANNPFLIDLNLLLNFSIFPVILGTLIFSLDFFLFKKNFLIKITAFLIFCNLFINFFFF